MTEAKVIQVIEVMTTRGRGATEADPIRHVKEYWSFDGLFLADNDPVRPDTKFK